MGKKISPVSNQRIPVSPEIVSELENNVSAAYYYAQLLFYNRYEKKTSNGWFSKNTKEIEHDIAIGRRQQEHSRKLLIERGWIETISVRGGLRPTMNFHIVFDYTRKTI